MRRVENSSEHAHFERRIENIVASLFFNFPLVVLGDDLHKFSTFLDQRRALERRILSNFPHFFDFSLGKSRVDERVLAADELVRLPDLRC